MSADELDWFRAVYDRRLAVVDASLAELLALVRALSADRPLVCLLTSDHGEGFDAERGRVHHGGRLHDDLLRVPLVLHAPGLVLGGRAVDAQVRTLDVLPTVLDLVGLAPPTDVAGTSLLPALRGAAPYPAEAFAEELADGLELRALRRDGWKRIAKPGPDEVYRVADDPAEATPRDDGPDELRAALAAFPTRFPPRPREEAELDAATRQHLQDLGYVGEDDAP